MSHYPEFARLLNQELQRHDRSASWLAQQLDVSPSTVGRWLNDGMRPGTPEMVGQIADVLGMTRRKPSLMAATGYGYVPTISADVESVAAGMKAAAGVSIPPLPAPTTPFLGRTEEKARLSAWLSDPDYRLITIVGPGGMGKTRLALTVAHEQLQKNRFEHDVAFVDLAPLVDFDQLPAAIAQSVGLSLESGGERVRSTKQQLLDFLHDRHELLVLDNAEHLLDGAGLVAEILKDAPSIKILVTSREPLRLPGEQLYPLRGLDYENGGALETTSASTSSSLFLQTARRVRPNYHVDIAEARHIAEICRLAQGLPLAIELAAAWVSLMSAGEIVDAIRNSLRFLETDMRGVPARHRSMEAVFDATWQRLDATEQRIFAQLSVFRGGFTQAAIEYVTGATLSQLRTLVTSSLIAYNHERKRYTIHELLRQYGALRLAEDAELERKSYEFHSQYYLALLRRRQDSLKNRALQTDLQVLDAEVDNLERAWQWATANGQVDGIVETLDGLGLYLQWRGRADEGESAFGLAAAAVKEAGMRRGYVRALAWQAQFARVLGQFDQVEQILDEGRLVLTMLNAENIDCMAERGFILMQSAAIAAGQDTTAAKEYYLESLSLFEAVEEMWFAAEVRLGLGHVCLIQGDFVGQRSYVQQALDTYRTLGNVRGTASALSMLADIDSYRGQSLSGLELGYESLAAFRSLDDRMGIATCLSRIGMTYMNLGDVVNARLVVDESVALFAEMGSRRDEVIAYSFLCAIELMAGNYQRAQVNAERAVVIATELEDQFVLGVAVGFLGWAQHYAGDLGTALKTLREAVTITVQTGATMDQVRWYSQLAFAQWKNGQGSQARAHCYKSLCLSVQVADPWSLLTAMSSTLAILADGEDPERAIELHSMLMQDPLCAASHWYADGIGQHITSAMHDLSDEVVTSAMKRGQGLEQLAEAEKLIDETAALGWSA